MDVEECVSRFEDCSLPIEQWDHLAHVVVAFQYAVGELDASIDKMRRGIQRYNAAVGTPNNLKRGYHETITQAFMKLVFAARMRLPAKVNFEQFRAQNPELFDKRVLGSYYSNERLFTAQSKAEFVEPDLAPLPRFLSESVSVSACLTSKHMEQIRPLMRAYAKSLDFDLCFQGFEEELASLPGKYTPPQGSMLLAYDQELPVGCVALRPHSETDCEMKRLWVQPTHRSIGLGRALAEAIIDEATRIGFQRIRLDTIETMREAIGLYESLGFERTEAYVHNPVDGAAFMQLSLPQAGN